MHKTQIQTLLILSGINFIVAILFLVSYLVSKEMLYLLVSIANGFALLVVIFLIIKFNKRLDKYEQ